MIICQVSVFPKVKWKGLSSLKLVSDDLLTPTLTLMFYLD